MIVLAVDGGTVTLDGTAVRVEGSATLRAAVDRLRVDGLPFLYGGEEGSVFVDKKASAPLSEEAVGLLIEALERAGYTVDA